VKYVEKAKSLSLDSVYFSTSAWKTIATCTGKLVVDESVQVIQLFYFCNLKNVINYHFF